jgi:hypothetical protein
MPNTFPAADTGLPTINRRSAGVLVVNSSDPVFDALAELQSVAARAKVIGHAHKAADDAMIEGLLAARPVEYDGKEFRSVDQLDRAFEGEGALTAEDITKLTDNLWKHHHEEAAGASVRESEYRAARAELEGIESAVAEAAAKSGFADIDAKQEEVANQESQAEDVIFETKPCTVAGALALLRFVADYGDQFTLGYVNAESAIRNALTVLEREA